MLPNALFCSSLVLLGLVATVNCISCHNCSSFLDPQCLDSPSSLINCTNPESFCRKTVQIILDGDIKRTTRTCGYIKFENHDGDYCMTSNTNFKTEVTCQCFTDECNKGEALTIGKMLLWFFVAALLWR